MKIVIGGANGLIGKRLVDELRKRGDSVIELVRKSRAPESPQGRVSVERSDEREGRLAERAQRGEPLRFPPTEWDGRSQGPWSAQIDGADAVINLAGANVVAHRWNDEFKKEISSSRIDSTRALVEAMRAAKQKPRAFISASAVGYYGPREDDPIDERAAPGKDFLAQVCVAWEAEAILAGSLGLRVACMRTGIVLAPEGQKSAFDTLVKPFRMFVGGHIGTGKQWFPWIHIEDELAAFLWTLDHDSLSGPINLASPGIENARDFSAALGKAIHRPAWARAPVPDVAIKLALGEFAEVALTGQRVIPAKLIESGFKFRFPDLSPALRNLLGAGT